MIGTRPSAAGVDGEPGSTKQIICQTKASGSRMLCYEKKRGIQGLEDGTQEKADIRSDLNDINEIKLKYCR